MPWKLLQVWTLEGAGQHLWAGTIPGGLFHSNDRGESWTLARSLWDRKERAEWFGGGYDQPGIHSICLDGAKITIAISCGGTWQSADGGASWRLAGKGMYAEFMPPERREDPNIQDVHRLAQCASRPEVFWAQHHNGVFRSTDGAASFQEIKAVTPSKFGFAVAVHPKNPDTAWFVPAVKDECRVPVDAKLVVARTRDGGQSFSVLRKGLPQESVRSDLPPWPRRGCDRQPPRLRLDDRQPVAFRGPGRFVALPLCAPAADPLRALRLIASASLLALAALCLAWELWLAPLRPGGSLVALKALPLALPLMGVMTGRRYTYQWSSLLILAYFAEGATRAWADSGLSRTLALAEVALSLAFFAAAVSYARLTRAGA